MEGISLSVRLWIGIPVAVVFLCIAGGFYVFGLGLGVMATDGCGADELPDVVTLYLLLAWPIVMGISSFLPPLLFIKNAKFIWTILSLFLGIVISVVWYIGWFFIVSHYCG